MGWIEDLQGTTVGLDTAPLIFYFEDKSPYADILDPFFTSLDSGSIQAVTSVITLTEVLVHPLRHSDEKLASDYQDILLSHPNVSAVSVQSAIAQHAAEPRAQYSLKTVDAIQLATALSQNATTFLTNDRDFGDVPGIKIIRLVDLKTAQ
jgi:predicted nucleic acid-binding protein